MNAWIGLGGNFAESDILIGSALVRLDEHRDIVVLRQSGMYRSPPWGIVDQADFFNAVAEVDTALPPGELLAAMQAVENGLGRDRSSPRWGPRNIDLDLLSYQDMVVRSRDLVLPHPRMHLRAFVLKPIMELEPGFEIPGVGPARKALERLDRSEVEAVRLTDH